MLASLCRVLLGSSLALASLGCGESSSTPELEPAPAGSAAVEASGAVEADGVPVIASDEATFEFGTIAPSEKVTHVFKLVNRGTGDLKIERVEKT